MTFFDALVEDNKQAWKQYTEHAFVEQMAAGTLPIQAFKYYLVQDYLFLIEFARAYALAIYKSPNMALMRKSLDSVQTILNVEMGLHVQYCQSWGLSEQEMQAAVQAPQTLAYTRYVLDAGMRGDIFDLKVALAPCVIGYGEIARRLAQVPNALDSENPYAPWIKEYSGEDYLRLMEEAKTELNELAQAYLTNARRPQIMEHFGNATRLEADFWQMGLERG
ncbi:thiaminase II [Polycladidibacter stylochi]|uniref:thiaminase II n=1 Tax=Polycladidibacter stylochi TaxID=1807766 RepID=UPI000830C846|nr:thiaminase II [Pseudovibrio stylochi]